MILVPFTDGITFEVVPAFVNKDDSYTFPDANDGGKWRPTNPRPEIEAIRTRNAACNGNLVPLCRMMRSWKRKWDVPIGGLLVDTLAYQFIENYGHRDKSYLYYDFVCRDFFQWMAGQDAQQEYWKAPGSGQFVHGKGLFQYKAKRCYNIALEAVAHDDSQPEAGVVGQAEMEGHLWNSIPRLTTRPSHERFLKVSFESATDASYTPIRRTKSAPISSLSRLGRVKVSQIVLSAITTAGFVAAVFGAGPIGAALGLIVSTVLLALNSYTKNYDLGELAQKHRQAANDLWLVRENYLSLLVDIAMKEKPLEALQKHRDQLVKQLHTVYSGPPSTTFQAYRKAQEALQKLEDMTFTDAEIDAFLPKELKRSH